MEHLIKQYSCFFGEALHQEKFFPNPLFRFHHLNVLIHKYYFRAIRFNTKTNRNRVSVGFFLLYHH